MCINCLPVLELLPVHKCHPIAFVVIAAAAVVMYMKNERTENQKGTEHKRRSKGKITKMKRERKREKKNAKNILNQSPTNGDLKAFKRNCPKSKYPHTIFQFDSVRIYISM